jgi:hypothetical protein
MYSRIEMTGANVAGHICEASRVQLAELAKWDNIFCHAPRQFYNAKCGWMMLLDFLCSVEIL